MRVTAGWNWMGIGWQARAGLAKLGIFGPQVFYYNYFTHNKKPMFFRIFVRPLKKKSW
jgi:hypothetical protein